MHLPANTSISYVRLRVADLERALTFYQRQLGLQITTESSASVQLSASAGAPFLLELIAVPNAIPKPPRATGLYHVAIRLPDREALARLFFRLVQLRVPFQGFSDHQVSEALYLSDPDGNGVELYRDRPRADWPRQGSQVAMTTEALDIDTLYKEGQHDLEESVHIDPGTDIGHIHLHIGDLARAEAFYVNGLGMDVMQRSYPGALFVAAGGYHHHIGLNIWAGRHAPSPPAQAVGLESFSVLIPEADAWSAATARLQDAGFRVEKDAASAERATAYDDDRIKVELLATPQPHA